MFYWVTSIVTTMLQSDCFIHRLNWYKRQKSEEGPFDSHVSMRPTLGAREFFFCHEAAISEKKKRSVTQGKWYPVKVKFWQVTKHWIACRTGSLFCGPLKARQRVQGLARSAKEKFSFKLRTRCLALHATHKINRLFCRLSIGQQYRGQWHCVVLENTHTLSLSRIIGNSERGLKEVFQGG